MWTIIGKEDGRLSRTIYTRVSYRLPVVKTKLITRSHLLLHDDSISSRLISYILYLPNSPADKTSPSADLRPSASGSFLKGWDPKWGGSLELFPVENGEEVGLPGVKRVSKVDVSWGQIIFFEVKPGRSYHAVEEVIVGDGRQRLGVSGWYVSLFLLGPVE